MTNLETLKSRVLVTGSRGFVGRHLLARLMREAERFSVIELPKDVDIRDPIATRNFVRETMPTHVVHLAAQSFVPKSFDSPRDTYEINVIGTLNLLSALSELKTPIRFLYISSGDVYGQVAEKDMPVSESLLPTPVSPYGSSKVAAEQLCLQWGRTTDLDCVVVRPFNHIGPGQDVNFVVPSLASQVSRIARSEAPPLILAGDIDTTRDFTDVRDIVDAYVTLLEAPNVGGNTYNVGSGIERSIRSLLERMCELRGVKPDIQQDPSLLRRSEQRRMCADASALSDATGWLPTIDIDQTILDIFRSIEE